MNSLSNNPNNSTSLSHNLRLSMPERLVLVRHGESQANLINRAIKNGIISEYPEGFANIPDREIRLSKNGVAQAQITGVWLKNQYPKSFDYIYVSDHTRAKETAGYLCKGAEWDNSKIRIDPLLGERNWGNFVSAELETRNYIMQKRKRDPLHNPMPDGETLLETRHRSRELLDRCAREFSGKRILVISHGEYIEALWSEIAHFNTERQLAFFHSKEGDIKNCQVIEFSSVNPTTSEAIGKFRWVRSSCPQANIEGNWSDIPRIEFSPEELLEEVNRYPILDFPDLLD